MSSHHHTLVAREGWLLISLALIATVLTLYFLSSIAAVPFLLVTLCLLFLFRDPPRKIPSSPLALVSPVDGTIMSIEQFYDDFLQRDATRITIKMNWFGIYSTRSPMEGKVMEQWLDGLSKDHREKGGIGAGKGKIAQWIQTDEGDDLVLCMVKDKITRRPGCMAHSGQRVGQGQRCGFIHFGALIEMLVPVNSRIEVKKGEKVLAGSDIVATLVRNSA